MNFPRRIAIIHQQLTSLLYSVCRVGEYAKLEAEQNIPNAKLCVYTSTGFCEEFHVSH